MIRLNLILVLIISNPIYGQVDSAKLDSLARQIDSRHRMTSTYQDSFIRAQDSAYHKAVEIGRQDITSHDTSFLAKKKRGEKRNESKTYVRPGIAALLLVLLVIGLLRSYKKGKQS